MNGEKDLVGVIPAGQNTIAFSNKETPFSFDFMVASFLEAKDATVLKVPTVDGFLYGKTINKQDVAIYMGQTKNFEIFNTAKIQTDKLLHKSILSTKNAKRQIFSDVAIRQKVIRLKNNNRAKRNVL